MSYTPEATCGNTTCRDKGPTGPDIVSGTLSELNRAIEQLEQESYRLTPLCLQEPVGNCKEQSVPTLAISPVFNDFHERLLVCIRQINGVTSTLRTVDI